VELRLDAGSRLEAIIGDNGTGIGRKELSKVFDPFFTTKTKGTGLGLTLSRELMHLCGGEINIESQKHKGTRVSLLFPR
jgi:signal transduction histidine kinase